LASGKRCFGLSTINSQLSTGSAPRALAFTADQLAWLEKMRDYISASGSVDREHFELSGQWGQVYRVFGDRVEELMEELSIALAA